MFISQVRPTSVGLVPAARAGVQRPSPSSRRAAYRLVGALDAHHFRFAQHRGVLDQPRGGLAEHHPAGRGDRFHPLRHPDLLADRGVTRCARADFAGNHLGRNSGPTRSRSVDTVAALDFDRPVVHDLLLDVQRRQTGAKSVILQARLARRTPP